MAFYLAPTSNFWSTTLNGSINNAVTTITLSSTTGLQAPGVLIIDREDGNGTATPSAREFISFTGISGSDITGVTRAFDNSTARSHSTGALVEAVPAVGLWNDVVTALRASLTTTGAGIALSGTASIANMRLTNSVNASGASIVGIFPSGASGSVLTSSGNALTPVFAAVALKVVQVVTATYGTVQTNTTQTYADTGLTATITPTSASNTILVFANQNGLYKGTGGNYGISINLLRGASEIALLGDAAFYGIEGAGGTGECYLGSVAIAYKDSPATTSATIYKTQFKAYGTPLTVKVQNLSATSTMVLVELAA